MAKLLGVSRSTAYRLAKEGKLPAQRRGPSYLVHRDDVAGYPRSREPVLIVPKHAKGRPRG